MPEPLAAKQARARKIVRALMKAYPDVKIALHFRTPLELLVATILAAQCTDERVNMVTPMLFRTYRAARDWANADLATLERGAAALAVRQPGPDVTARVRILPASDRPFALAADEVRIGGVLIPRGFVHWVIRNYDPSWGLASRSPVPVSMGRVEIAPDAVRISANP